MMAKSKKVSFPDITKWINLESKKNCPISEEPTGFPALHQLKARPFSEETGRYLIKVLGSVAVSSFSLFGVTLAYCCLLEKELWPIIIFPIAMISMLLIPLFYYSIRMFGKVLKNN